MQFVIHTCTVHYLLGTQALNFPIPGGIYLASFEENAPVSGDIVQVGCTDSQGIPLTNPTYNITDGSSQLFTIEEDSGQISWISNSPTLDYETTTFYLFTVSCSDNEVQPNTATAMVNVSVLPVNEFPPVINVSSLLVLTFENAPMGTVFVSTRPGARGQQGYSVTDADAGPDGVIKYTLGNPDATTNTILMLDPVDGTLSLTRELDVDNFPGGLSLLNVQIVACDTDPPRAECPSLAVTLFIRAAADNDPMFANNQKTVSYFENTPVGTVIATSNCTDLDVREGEYAGIDIMTVVPSESTESFRLDAGDNGHGMLVLVSSLDYETVRSYNITIRCFDDQVNPNIDIANVYVIVLPVNDEPPQFQATFYSFAVNRISASGVDIGQVIAIDNDLDVGAEISYSIISGDVSNFGVRPDGMVYLKDFVFAYEGESFELVVMASDGEFNSTTEVILTVSGFLSIPEIVVILISAIIFIILVVIIVVIVCTCCCKCLPRYI